MENFKEIRTLTGHGLSYLSIQELQSMLSAEYRILHAEEEIIPLYFTSPMDVLYHLKRTGVTGAGKKNWTRRELIVFCEEYIQLFGYDGSVPLTYHPVYIIAHKKFTS